MIITIIIIVLSLLLILLKGIQFKRSKMDLNQGKKMDNGGIYIIFVN